jgi:signal transduction protein with GAF and PtsI domain
MEEELCEQVETLLKNDPNRETVLEQILHVVLANFHSETGTIHRLDSDNQLLYLMSQVGLPPQLLDIVKTIPVGKGIAGQVIAAKQAGHDLQSSDRHQRHRQTRREADRRRAAPCACRCETATKLWEQSVSAQSASMNTHRMKRANWRKSAG